jgi:hypothetical protein
MIQPRWCRSEDEKAIMQMADQTSVIEMKLRWAVASYRDELWQVPDVLHRWISRQDDPLTTTNRLAGLLLVWQLDPYIDREVREIIQSIEGYLPHWREGFDHE